MDVSGTDRMTRVRSRCKALLRTTVATTAVAVAFPAGAAAVSMQVSTTGDVVANDGSCSLREAISAANGDAPSGAAPGECPAGSGSDTVSLPGGSYTLGIVGFENANAAGDLDVTSTVTIAGAGAATTTIDGAGIDRVLEIAGGATATVEGVTLTGGRARSGGSGGAALAGAGGAGGDHPGTGAGGNGGQGGMAAGGSGATGEAGGGIRNAGTLTLTASVVTGNAAGDGGGGGDATGGNAGRGGNSVGGAGGNGGNGGAAVGGNGGNGGAGGGIASFGTLTIVRSSVTANSAGEGGAGGDATSGNGGNAGSTIGSGNAGSAGAGAAATGGTGGTGGQGGGIASANGILTISSSTIADNAAGDGGAGGAANAGEGGNGGDAVSGNPSAGGAGGAAAAGPGGPGRDGGGVLRPVPSQTYTDVTIAENRAGAGARGGNADGGGGGQGGSVSGGGSGAVGGGGGASAGGDGGDGGNTGGANVASALFLHATVADNRSGTAGVGGDGVAGPGGPGGTGGLNGSTGAAGSGQSGSGGAAGSSGGLVGTGQLKNTIVAGNAPGNCQGSFTDAGNTLSFPGATCPGAHADPRLLTLGDNGGPTQTIGLADGSPALGAVAATGDDCTATDQRGFPRPQGGGCDIGAYERTAPLATTGAATAVGFAGATLNGSVTPNHRTASVRFEFGTTTAYGASTPARETGADTAAENVSEPVGGLLPSTTYHYRLVATTPDGVSEGADRTFTTSPAPPAAPGDPSVDAPPVIGAASLSSSVFAVARGRTPAAAGARRGTTIRYTLSEAATVRIVVQRAVSGRRKGRRCVKPTPKLRRAKRCTRHRTVMTLSRAAAAGAGSTRFTGRVGRRRLRPGRHRFRLRATDTSGKRSPARNLAFRVVKG